MKVLQIIPSEIKEHYEVQKDRFELHVLYDWTIQ